MRAAVISKDEKMIDFLISEFKIESAYYYSSIHNIPELMKKYESSLKLNKITMLMYAARISDF